MKKIFNNIFSSLQYRNFRLFLLGQFISLTGSWIQALALNWIAYEMTGSAVTLGIITSLQFLPLLFFGIFGGYLVDRLPKYKTVLWLQILQFVGPFIVSVLLFLGEVSVNILYACALWYGLLRVVDSPVRQSLRYELVPKNEIKNVISLFSTINGIGRTLGPLLSGALLVSFGPAWSFLLNAISYLFVVFLVLKMRVEEFYKKDMDGEEEVLGLYKELKQIWKNRIVKYTLVLATIVGIFTLTMQTTAPIFVKQIFSGNAFSYAVIIAFYSIGCVLGGLYGAQDKIVNKEKVVNLAFLLSFLCAGLFLPLNYIVFLFLCFLLGFVGILLTNNANALIVIHSKENQVGLTSSLWAMAIIGTNGLGGLYIGYSSEYLGIQTASLVSAIILFVGVYFYKIKINKYGKI